jgi:arabinogalactan endo-1,4-beta-galactosidase
MRTIFPVVALSLLQLFSTARAKEKDFALPFLFGGDTSMVPKMEADGVVYKDGGVPKDFFAIFRDRGANTIRLRLFVDPNGRGGVVNDIPYTIALAKRVKAAGLIFILDFHYSDTWADPGKQGTPKAWSQLPFPQLVSTTHDYTASTLKAFRAAGAAPDIVQIGNEITHGLLWPIGMLSTKAPAQDAAFDRVSAILKADADAVHAALGEHTKILIHIDGADATGTVKWFFDNITKRGVPFDIIGLSYYPQSGSNLSHVKETLAMAANSYGKPIVIAETAYPFASSLTKDASGKSYNWPLTPTGQKQYFMDLLHLVLATPHGLGAGILYWYPESVPYKEASQHQWNQGNDAMFDRDGNALPILDVFHAPRS